MEVGNEMTADPDEQAHMRCVQCHGVKARRDLIFIDDKPVCLHGEGKDSCREKFHVANRPRPRRIDARDDGHC